MKPWELEHDEEPEQEGGMSVSNLERTKQMAEDLLGLIEPSDAIPGWVLAKLTSVYEDLNDVHGYIMGLAEGGPEAAIGEGKKKGLWANIHARRKAGKRPKRPGEKGYPKTLDIEEGEGEQVVKEAIQAMIDRHRRG